MENNSSISSGLSTRYFKPGSNFGTLTTFNRGSDNLRFKNGNSSGINSSSNNTTMDWLNTSQEEAKIMNNGSERGEETGSPKPLINNSRSANSIAGVYSFGREGIRVGGTPGGVNSKSSR